MRLRLKRPGRKKIAVAMVLAGVLLFAVFGNNGLIDAWKLRKERDDIARFNAELEGENGLLARKIELLKTDKRYIGHIARTELGMIGPNEVVYRIEDQ